MEKVRTIRSSTGYRHLDSNVMLARIFARLLTVDVLFRDVHIEREHGSTLESRDGDIYASADATHYKTPTEEKSDVTLGCRVDVVIPCRMFGISRPRNRSTGGRHCSELVQALQRRRKYTSQE